MNATAKRKQYRQVRKRKHDWALLVIFIPALVFYAVYRYLPMVGVLVAFKDYSPFRGFLDSPWVGLDNFRRLFNGGDFKRLIRNTVRIGFSNLAWTFPITIIFSLLLNEIRHKFFKKTFQTISYLPSFLSVVIISSITMDVVSLNGVINTLLSNLGFENIHFIVKPEWFTSIYVASSVWQSTGSGAIIFLAAIAGIDPALYESASIDGCSRLKAMWYITIPTILPTIMTLLVLQSASVFRVGQDKILLLYNPMTRNIADVFSSFIYRQGIAGMDYSYAAAAGLFEGLIAGSILWLTNFLSGRLTESSLW